MTFHLSLPAKIEGNSLIHPEITLTIQKGTPVALQMEPEFMASFLAAIEEPVEKTSSFSFEDQTPYDHKTDCFIHQLTDGLYKRLTARQTLAFWKKLYNSNAQLQDLLSFTELTSVADKRIRFLNDSEIRRLHFARSLITSSVVCLFDQPTHHVDRQTKHVFQSILKRLEHRYVILLTTSLEEAVQLGQAYQLTERGLESVENSDSDSETAHPFKVEKISAKVDDKIILFDPMELDYIESLDGQTLLHVNGEMFQTTVPLKDLEKRLIPFGFFRCHRSYLVNLQRVREIIVWSRNSYSLSLKDKKKSTIPLSKGNYGSLKDLLNM
ncbi:ABC transporter ATP-binding protein [Bacillus sp. JCM 19046]|uniref:ABC-2 type transport system ATP-binding protein n=1 Tax=Shouchella xiaoxiensis TaxID=766895 RepID=A0ABS2SUS9_9BACI|nr:LytTR family transcriptional regulator DNA-binding domain-containing protein [Shouchella xiaoxiensis]MBM7839257.1 ABC-2 type transport system ATP-binding protein [Shouchella xiaoxiensis]GAF15706.1 ABC transporter ATP-binding protein [Bacillus sp. JCM 19046]